MMAPKWGPHITIIRHELVRDVDILSYQGKKVNFRYAHRIVTNDKHLWLPVESEELLAIRQALGLFAQPLFPPHLTIAVMPASMQDK